MPVALSVYRFQVRILIGPGSRGMRTNVRSDVTSV